METKQIYKAALLAASMSFLTACGSGNSPSSEQENSAAPEQSIQAPESLIGKEIQFNQTLSSYTLSFLENGITTNQAGNYFARYETQSMAQNALSIQTQRVVDNTLNEEVYQLNFESNQGGTWQQFDQAQTLISSGTFTLSNTSVNQLSSRLSIDATQDLSVDTRTIESSQDVTLESSQYAFTHWQYQLNNDFSMFEYQEGALTTTNYQSYILENEFLRVELVPEFGGRIMSIFNKTTGHENLYQNPVGAPYLVGEDIFYYDWLMIMGGIFPTFPEAEHGKTWLRSWDFEVVSESSQSITVAMHYQDNDEYTEHPETMPTKVTMLKCTFYITLTAGRAALDTRLELSNPTTESQPFELWQGLTFSPGVDTTDTRATSALEIVLPIDEVNVEWGYGVDNWQQLKFFDQHQSMGSAYPTEGMYGQTFAGAINQDNKEGIFRIADYNQTPGMKIWSFGYDNTLGQDATISNDWARPSIELWAGVTDKFHEKTVLLANDSFSLLEIYAPTSGLTQVTHSNQHLLANLTMTTQSFYFLHPNDSYTIELYSNESLIFSSIVQADALNANHIDSGLPADQVKVTNSNGEVIFEESIR